MNKRTAQRGLSMIGFLFVAAVVVAIVMIGFRTLPSYIEYFTVKKVMAKTLQDAPEPFSLPKPPPNAPPPPKPHAEVTDREPGSDDDG